MKQCRHLKGKYTGKSVVPRPSLWDGSSFRYLVGVFLKGCGNFDEKFMGCEIYGV